MIRPRVVSHILAPLATFAMLLVAWEIVARAQLVNAVILPAPSAILTALRTLGALAWLDNIFATLRVALMGLVAAIVISIPMAMALSRSRFLASTLYPLLVVVRSLPIVAIAPIIIALAGTSDLPRVIITFLITFFPIVVSTVTGLAQVPPELIELSRSLRASTWREMWDIRLPSAIPYIFSSLKVASTLVVTGAVVAEFVAADKGVGYLVVVSMSMFKTPIAFAALSVLVVICLALFYSIDLIQKLLFPWSLAKDE